MQKDELINVMWMKEQISSLLLEVMNNTSNGNQKLIAFLQWVTGLTGTSLLNLVETLSTSLLQIFQSTNSLNWSNRFKLLPILSFLAHNSANSSNASTVLKLWQGLNDRLYSTATQSTLNEIQLKQQLLKRMFNGENSSSIIEWLLSIVKQTKTDKSIGLVLDCISVILPDKWDDNLINLAFGATNNVENYYSYLLSINIHHGSWDSLNSIFKWIFESNQQVGQLAIRCHFSICDHFSKKST